MSILILIPHIHELYDFTTSAYILHPTEPKLCLHFHRKLHKWIQPGGHIELNEDPIMALEHELEEEVGFKPSDFEFFDQPDQPHPEGEKTLPIPFHMFTHFYDAAHQHIDMMYLLKAKKEQFNPAEGESSEIGWFTIDELRQMYTDDTLAKGQLDACEWIAAKYF